MLNLSIKLPNSNSLFKFIQINVSHELFDLLQLLIEFNDLYNTFI